MTDYPHRYVDTTMEEMEAGFGPRRRLNPTETYGELIHEFNEHQMWLRNHVKEMKATWEHMPDEDKKFFKYVGPPIDVRPLVESYERAARGEHKI